MLIIAVVSLSVIAGVFAGISLFVSIRNQQKEFQRSKRVMKALRRHTRRRLIGALSRHTKETEQVVVELMKKVAAKEAGFIFSERAEGLVSAKVSEAMTRQMKILKGSLVEELEKTKLVQKVRMDSMDEAVTKTDSLLSKIMQGLHFQRKKNGAVPISQPSTPIRE